MWRAAPLPATPVCAEQLAEGRLLLSTTSNTYILEGKLLTKDTHLNFDTFFYDKILEGVDPNVTRSVGSLVR